MIRVQKYAVLRELLWYWMQPDNYTQHLITFSQKFIIDVMIMQQPVIVTRIILTTFNTLSTLTIYQWSTNKYWGTHTDNIVILRQRLVDLTSLKQSSPPWGLWDIEFPRNAITFKILLHFKTRDYILAATSKALPLSKIIRTGKCLRELNHLKLQMNVGADISQEWPT